MRTAYWVLAAALVGCSTDASGLGGDFVEDATNGDSASSGSETSPVFPDEDGSVAVDSGMPIEMDSATSDTEVPDTEMPDTAAPDTAMPDTAIADSGSATDSTPADTGTTPTDTGSDGGVTSVPGRVSCGSTMCPTGQDCCESGGTFSCKTSCGFSSAYRCDEKADCAGGQVCCISHALIGDNWNGSFCIGTDYCLREQACRTNADCSGGKVCSPGPSEGPSSFAYCK